MGKIHWGWATALIFVAVFVAIVSADAWLEYRANRETAKQ